MHDISVSKRRGVHKDERSEMEGTRGRAPPGRTNDIICANPSVRSRTGTKTIPGFAGPQALGARGRVPAKLYQ